MRKRVGVPVREALTGASPKSQDDKDFLARWIPFGMALKAQADGFGVGWRGKSLELWQGEITFAQVWSESNPNIERC